MRKSIKQLAIVAATTLIAWTHVNAQDTGLDALPEGFPVELVTYLGDNRYTSPVFGNFTRVTSRDDYFLHDTLGPLTWEWDADTLVVTLNTEFFGPLKTALPNDVTPLGFSFPLVRHETTQVIYGVDVGQYIYGENADPEAMPFEKWAEGDGGVLVSEGTFAFMGWALDDGASFYNAALDRITELQAITVELQADLNTLVNTPAMPNVQNHEPIWAAISARWDLFGQVFVRYIYFRERTFNAESFIANPDENPELVTAAREYEASLRGLNDFAEDIFETAATLVNEAQNQYLAKLALRAQMEEAARQPSPSPSPSPSPTPTPTPGGGSGGGSSGGDVDAGDAISWSEVTFIARANPSVANYNKSAEITSFRIHRGSYYGPESWYVDVRTSGTSGWSGYLPFGSGNPVMGNIWIFSPNGSGYYATPFEGFTTTTTILPLGNLNFDHSNILIGSPLGVPWQPSSGTNYGWMVSTNAGLYPGGNGSFRTNIVFQRWP